MKKPALIISLFISIITVLTSCGESAPSSTLSPQPLVLGDGQGTFTIGKKLYSTQFKDTENWTIQVQQQDIELKPDVSFESGMLDLYMPARGCTAWLKQKFSGPITIIYRVRCPLETINGDEIQARDINNFWHASDIKKAEDIFDSSLYTGNFGTYGKMQGYYASTGGGGHVGNQTTRFRRYPREIDGKDVPHIALTDRDGQKDYLITPDKWHTVQLVAYNGLVQYIVDGLVVYEIKEGDPITVTTGKESSEAIYNFTDFPPYTEGYFGFRLVRTHHQYKDLAIYQLDPAENK